MRLKQLLAIEAILGKKIPKDVLDENVKYYSESREAWVPMLDMDIIHLTRVAKKNLDANDKLYLQRDVVNNYDDSTTEDDEKSNNTESEEKEKWTRWALDNIS